MRARWLLVPLAVLSIGCSSSKGTTAANAARRSTTTTSTSTTSTTAASTTTTVPFAGGTDNVSVPMGTDHTTLLTKVTVDHAAGIDRVTFQFRDAGVPGVEAGYVTHPTADGSGAAIKVEGSNYLQVRMSPAAAVDLSGENPRPTYSGPVRVRGAGTTAVTEVVQSGDFEANLTWVIGLRSKAPFRVSTLTNPSRVVVELAAP
jgi:hypothetical protein